MNYEQNLVLRMIFGVLFMGFYGVYDKLLFPLTVYPSYFILNLFYDARLMDDAIFLQNSVIKFIPACIAVVAYSLLFLLIIFTKDIKLEKGLKMFFLGALLILAMNIIRIDLLLVVLVEFGSNWFDKLHLLFWDFVSGVYVAFVWIYLVKRYKVKSIPIYSDIRELYRGIKPKRGKIKKKSKKSK